MPCRSCNEFSRAKLMRQAAAQAGRGLPPIEPGQPVPAGTGLSRRSFLLRSGAVMLSIYGSGKLGFEQLEAGIAQAAGSTDPVLVNVFMEGGVDSLSVLAPINDSTYQSLRPNLSLKPSDYPSSDPIEFRDDSSLFWHPSAKAFDDLNRADKLTVFPAIGYTDPDQSHFTSRHYWEVGELDPNGRTGWLGRFLDIIGTDDNPLQGLSLDGFLSPSLATASVPVAAIDGPSYDLWAPGVWDEVEDLMFTAATSLGDAHYGGADSGLGGAGKVEGQSMRVREQLKPFADGFEPPASYPDNYFASSLAALAAMLQAGLPIRCVSVEAEGGYDTHDGEEDSLPGDLLGTTQALAAFQADLEARGLADRVITLVWSEFGRRPEENGSGTDHGAAGAAFLMGTKAKGQMIGEFPGLTSLDEDDNLMHTSDFRGVYCSLLEQWFGRDAAEVIPGASGFARPDLIKTT
jgi:uncharacterized protein (DUF1501 family)